MTQLALSEAEFHHKKRKTRRGKFLDKMDSLAYRKMLNLDP